MTQTTFTRDECADTISAAVRELSAVQAALETRCDGPDAARAALHIGFEIAQLELVIPILRQLTRADAAAARAD